MVSNWKIIYRKYIKAVEVMEKILASRVDYKPRCIPSSEADEAALSESNLIIIGENPPEEGYTLKVCESRYNKENQMILLSGCDDIHTLYGVYDFESKYLVFAADAGIHMPVYYFNRVFYDPMKPVDIHSVPKKKNRGLWTWGHVIYDYKGYIDNMVRLKLNEIIVWNDFIPTNAREFTDYAHQNGIRVIWGFAWGWDTVCLDVDISDLDAMSDGIVEKFEREYADSGCDGIYFQSFTETNEENIGGICIAEAVTSLVNKTYEKLISAYPGLEVQFGLHATSVKEKLSYISKVNPEIYIVWEDCGAFPYHYMPYRTEAFEETMEFTKKITRLREKERFGAILKGNICLDWSSFRHLEAPLPIGSSPDKAREVSEERKAIWKYIQSWWMVNADKAKELIDALPEDSVIAALVEDGAFEAEIRFPTALYAEILWGSELSPKELTVRVAQSPYVKFA